MTQVFKDFVRNVLQGKVLSIEDAVDVLSLKDNDETLGDFAMALHLLAEVQVCEGLHRLCNILNLDNRTFHVPEKHLPSELCGDGYISMTSECV